MPSDAPSWHGSTRPRSGPVEGHSVTQWAGCPAPGRVAGMDYLPGKLAPIGCDPAGTILVLQPPLGLGAWLNCPPSCCPPAPRRRRRPGPRRVRVLRVELVDSGVGELTGFFPRIHSICSTATLRRYLKGKGLGFRAEILGLGLGSRA